MKIISLSGNYCTDKKAAALNWIDGRGKSVVALATIPASVVETVLHVDVADLVDASIKKNFKVSLIPHHRFHTPLITPFAFNTKFPSSTNC